MPENNNTNETQVSGQDPRIVQIPYGFYDNNYY
jgi:hypothetical protein